jgi:hypothetical protein
MRANQANINIEMDRLHNLQATNVGEAALRQEYETAML